MALYPEHAGRFVAASEGDVFAADDAWEPKRLAQAKHPDDEPFVQFFPKDHLARIYAH